MGAFVKRRSDVLEAIRKSLREEKEAVSNTLPVPVYNTLPAVLDEKLYKSGTSLPPPQENEPKKVIFVDETGNASFDLEKFKRAAYKKIKKREILETPGNISEICEVNQAKLSNLLSNPLVNSYISDSLKLDGNNATKIFGALSIKSATDEKVAEVWGMPLNLTRSYLTKFYEIGAVSLERKKDSGSGWYTYFWKVDTNNLENLRNFCISDIKEKIEAKKSELKDLENGKYVCEKLNGNHPALDFGSDELEETGYKCKDCGEPLIFKTEDELAEPIEKEIYKLMEAIEEVSMIEV